MSVDLLNLPKLRVHGTAIRRFCAERADGKAHSLAEVQRFKRDVGMFEENAASALRRRSLPSTA